MTAQERRLQEEVREFLAETASRPGFPTPLTSGSRRCATGRAAATRPGTSDARGRASSAAAVGQRWSRSSSTRSSPRRARPSSSTSSGSTCSARRCCASATTSSDTATSPRSCPPRRSGARASPSPTPGPIWRRSGLGRSSRTVTLSSAARRPGSRGASSRAGAACSRAPRICSPALARPRRVPHKGISMLIVDMHSPGVEVRPMTQITGHAEFCELFLDEVVVPKENLLSAPRRRLEDRDVHARPRARHGGAPAPGQAAHLARPPRPHRRRARARRRAAAR